MLGPGFLHGLQDGVDGLGRALTCEDAEGVLMVPYFHTMAIGQLWRE